MQPTYPSIPADGSVKVTLPVSCAPQAFGTEFAPSLESFKFTDQDGDAFEALLEVHAGVDDVIELRLTNSDTDELTSIEFYKADARKLIALIAEAAK